MFLRANMDVDYFFKRVKWIKYLDEDNISRKSKFYVKRISKKINDKTTFAQFKYWVLWRWVNKNFELSEHFVNQVKRNIKKLDLTLSSKEERFLDDLDELIFNSWRPLKLVPVKFELEKKEKINLLQTSVNVHHLFEETSEKKLKMIGKFDVYFSNKKVYLTSNKQVSVFVISYKDIVDVIPKSYGTIIKTKEKSYLFRGKNRLLTYVLLQRMIPDLGLNIQKIQNLYEYFDYWNSFLARIN